MNDYPNNVENNYEVFPDPPTDDKIINANYGQVTLDTTTNGGNNKTIYNDEENNNNNKIEKEKDNEILNTKDNYKETEVNQVNEKYEVNEEKDENENENETEL